MSMNDEVMEGMEGKALKASFDRFGDDLSQLIFSFLTIEDKFRFQCLSTQWRRLVFNKQLVFIITARIGCFGSQLVIQTLDKKNGFSAKNIDINLFEQCLQKLKYLSEINIESDILINPRILEIIADNCHHLRRFSFDWNYSISDETIDYFGQKCGQNIKTLSISNSSGYLSIRKISNLLSFTPQLISLNVSKLDSKFLFKTDCELLLPKLREIQFNSCNIEDIIGLRNRYWDQLVVIKGNLEFSFPLTEQQLQVISSFGTFRRLQSLDLSLSFDRKLTVEDVHRVYQTFRQMGSDCQQMRRLSIQTPKIPKDLSTFNTFTQLTSLYINFNKFLSVNPISVSFADLKQLSHLKHLNICFIGLSDHCFENIGHYLPQLKSLTIRTSIHLTDKSFQSISELKQLKSLEIICETTSITSTITSSSVKQLLANCHHLRRLVLNDRNGRSLGITILSIEMFKEKAKQNPKFKYFFSFNAYKPEIVKTMISDIPNNLTIVYR